MISSLKDFLLNHRDLVFAVVKIAAMFAVIMPMVAYSVLAERKISAFIQDRVGPNRAKRRTKDEKTIKKKKRRKYKNYKKQTSH